MCGICGIIQFNQPFTEEHKIRSMMLKMKHRGPDDEGVFFDNHVGLGFVRLSILDLSMAGHQPMPDQSNRYVVLHNGEVYNYIELRNELLSKGYKFKSNTDTEVILNSYIEWGEKCLDKFNGMWAFVIYDQIKKKMLIARDRYGIKPLYYHLNENKFIFASEIPAILAVLEKKSEANHQAIFDYLVFNRTDQTEATFFKDIRKLQHGSTICLSGLNCTEEIKPRFEIRKWYDLRDRISKAAPFKDPEDYRETFTSAVSLRLRSDVPVGVCLSGGLDSSSIVSVLLKDCQKTDLNTFSAIYPKGQFGDESSYISEYTLALKNMYYTWPSAETLLQDIDIFVKAHGEPVPSTSPYAQFKVMELAKDYVVVTLDGQGADEQLAGYHYFFGFYFKDLLKHFRYLHFISETCHYLKNHRSVFGLATLGYFLLPGNFKTKARIKERGYFTQNFINSYSEGNKVSDTIYGSETLKDALLDHFEYKLEHLLKWEDRNSMWFSLESRVPFLDYRLVERTLAIDADQIINKGTTKYILREALKNTLPESIRNRRDKIGFATPAAGWFRTEKFAFKVQKILRDSPFLNNGIIDRKKAINAFTRHLNGKQDINRDIWKWINLEQWSRVFL